MAEYSQPPSIFSLIWLFTNIASHAITRAITYPLRTRRGPSLRKDVQYAAIRAFTQHVTIAQSRYLLPSTTNGYLKWCKKNYIEPITLHIPTPGLNAKGYVQGHWLGSPNADTTVLYLHGGGYAQSMTEGNLQYWNRFVRENDNGKKGASVSVLILAYTLTPEARYPTQLSEASATLSHLINVKGKSASDIFIAGDSAGGNLAISLLSHLLHPHPDVQAVTLDAPLRGALLISPWTSFNTDIDSYTRNIDTDILDPSTRRWAAMLLGQSNANPELDAGPVVGDAYNEAASNDSKWWEGMHRVVSHVLDWSGSDECLVDGIRQFDRRFADGWVRGGGDKAGFLSVESPRLAHIAPISGIMMDPEGFKNQGQVAIEEWFGVRLER